jgi:hypothetical protein
MATPTEAAAERNLTFELAAILYRIGSLSPVAAVAEEAAARIGVIPTLKRRLVGLAEMPALSPRAARSHQSRRHL